MVDVKSEINVVKTPHAQEVPPVETLLSAALEKSALLTQFISNFKYFDGNCFMQPSPALIKACAETFVPQIFRQEYKWEALKPFKHTVLANVSGAGMVACAAIEANCLYTFGGSSAIFTPICVKSYMKFVVEALRKLPGGYECINRKISNDTYLYVERNGRVGKMKLFDSLDAAPGYVADRICYLHAQLMVKGDVAKLASSSLHHTSTLLMASESAAMCDPKKEFYQLCQTQDKHVKSTQLWV